MKKRISFLLSMLMWINILCLTVSADNMINVYVTISDQNGKLVLAQEKITVSDIDHDGNLTLNDALYTAHEEKYNGGAIAGYHTDNNELIKLWGIENGGAYGYYINHAATMGITTPLKNGDHIYTFIYTDLIKWTDTYCYFDILKTQAKKDSELTLTLMAKSYDIDLNPVTVLISDATITINGEPTAYKTNPLGKVTIPLHGTGEFLISAISDTQTLIPPVCKISVTDTEILTDITSDNTDTSSEKFPVIPVIIVVAILLFAFIYVLIIILIKKAKLS